MARKKSPTAALRSFDSAFGPGVPYRAFTEADRERLHTRLPPACMALLERDGWCSYKDQVLWSCDPDDWRAAVKAWLPDRVRAEAVLRTSFGDLMVWDGEMFWYVMVHDAIVASTVDDDAWFLSHTLTAKDFAPQTHLPGRTRRAREVAGELAPDEMYAYVPALAAGGSEAGSRVVRVAALEQLVLLAGLTDIQWR